MEYRQIKTAEISFNPRQIGSNPNHKSRLIKGRIRFLHYKSIAAPQPHILRSTKIYQEDIL